MRGSETERSGRQKAPPRVALPVVGSVLLHAAVIGSGAWLLARSLATQPPRELAVPSVQVAQSSRTVELPSFGGVPHADAADPPPQERPATPGGGEHTPRPDNGPAGRGGADVAQAAALNLADSVDGITLTRAPMNRLDRSQLQRLKTADARRSRDDRRATPNPMQLSFLASGRGGLAARRPPAEFDPAQGVMNGSRSTKAGGAMGSVTGGSGEADGLRLGAAEAGARRQFDAQGVPHASPGRDYRRSARVALARPWVPRSRAAVPSNARGRPSDTRASRQEVAGAIASLIHASTAGGALGAGPGGSKGPGKPAAGGLRGSGSRSRASGRGAGPLRDYGRDPALTGYFRGIVSKLEPLWRDAFPDWAIAQGRAGVAVVSFTIRADGTVANLRVTRISGVAEFDRNVVLAVQRASPFPKPPRRLGPVVNINMTFDAMNPAIRQ